MKRFFLLFAVPLLLISLLPVVEAQVVPPRIDVQLVDGLGDPIDSNVRFRVSLWSESSAENDQWNPDGSINTSSPVYAGYETTFVAQPQRTYYQDVLVGRYIFEPGDLAGFPSLSESNQFLQLEYKTPPGSGSGGYTLYRFSNSVNGYDDRFPLMGLHEAFVTPGASVLESDTLILDSDDSSADQISLRFGDMLLESLSFDIDADLFVLSNDLSLLGSELVDFRVENLSADPATCVAADAGRVYYNSSDQVLRICDGTSWGDLTGGVSSTVDIGNTVYVDSTRAAQSGEVYASLSAAVSYVETQSPGAANPWRIVLPPEGSSDSVTIPAYTSVEGVAKNLTELTGDIILSGGSTLKSLTLADGAELSVPATTTGYVIDADVLLGDGAGGGIDGILVVNDSFVDGLIDASGVLMAYNSVLGPSSLVNNGSVATYQSTVLTFTNNQIWNNASAAYDGSLSGLAATTSQEALDEITTSEDFVINRDDDGSESSQLSFGTQESLRWDAVNDYFELSDALVVDGNINANGNTFRLNADETGNPDEDVEIIAGQGTESAGVLRYNDGTNQWEFSNNGVSFSPLSGGYTARKQGFVTLPAGVTGTISVTGVGFQPNFVEFTLNNDIEAVNFDSVSPTNVSTEQGSFGWGRGFAYDRTYQIEQQVQFFSGSSNSINAHRSYSSDSQALFIVASDQNGNDLGRIEGTVTNFGADGFDLTITTSSLSSDYVMMYSAQRLSGTEIVFQDQGTSETSFTIDQDNVGAGVNVNIVANQGSDADGVLRYNATSNEWELSNNGVDFVPLLGWYASSDRIKLLPTDFVSDDQDDNGEVETNGAFIEASSGTTDLTATIDIPAGYRATEVIVYGGDTGNSISVYANDISNNTTATLLGSGNVGSLINISDLSSSSTNYLSIAVDTGNNDQLYGGYVTIEPIP